MNAVTSAPTNTFLYFCNILRCCDNANLAWSCPITDCLWDMHISMYNTHSYEFCLVDNIFSKEFNDSSLVWYGWVVHLACQHLTMSQCSFLFGHAFCCIAHGWLASVSLTQPHDHLWLAMFASSTKNRFQLNSPHIFCICILLCEISLFLLQLDAIRPAGVTKKNYTSLRHTIEKLLGI